VLILTSDLHPRHITCRLIRRVNCRQRDRFRDCALLHRSGQRQLLIRTVQLPESKTDKHAQTRAQANKYQWMKIDYQLTKRNSVGAYTCDVHVLASL
jgi:hypothetical protein